VLQHPHWHLPLQKQMLQKIRKDQYREYLAESIEIRQEVKKILISKLKNTVLTDVSESVSKFLGQLQNPGKVVIPKFSYGLDYLCYVFWIVQTGKVIDESNKHVVMIVKLYRELIGLGG